MTPRRLNPCNPRIVALTLSIDGAPPQTLHYAAPNDGRDLEDLTLGELRPYPAMDAAIFLRRITKEG